MSNDTIGRTVIVAVSVCIVCSIIVSTAAVLLRPTQQENKLLDKKRNILAAAGLLQADKDIESQFANITPQLVDVGDGQLSDAYVAAEYDQRAAANDPQLSVSLSSEEDVAKISRRSRYAVSYMLMDGDKVDKIILPVHGYGLWSTMYGFLALESDFNTIAGIGFYEHAETPGLGGEIDNPNWKKLWIGKKIYRDEQNVGFTVIKGNVQPGTAGSEYLVDGIAGATLTVKGVDNMIKYWLGKDGFAPFLTRLKKEGL